jgi:hypothetical protein
MPLTLEDLDRRVSALELAQSARSENALARLEQKVDAFPRVVAEMMSGLRVEVGATEHRLEAKIAECEGRLEAKIAECEDRLEAKIEQSEDRLRAAISTSVDASEQRMREVVNTVVGAAEQRTASRMNDFEQRILVALDRLRNP